MNAASKAIRIKFPQDIIGSVLKAGTRYYPANRLHLGHHLKQSFFATWVKEDEPTLEGDFRDNTGRHAGGIGREEEQKSDQGTWLQTPSSVAYVKEVKKKSS